MTQSDSPRVPCVDDAARVLEGLFLSLRKDYVMHTTSSGEVA
jgi:hypothetical protein